MKDKNQQEDKQKYDDILHLPHHVSRSHPHMPRADRAAQFSPFAALTGYKEAIGETGRRTENRMELEEDMKIILDEKLRMLQEQAAEHPKAAITYFLPDERKEGGTYSTVHDCIKKIDPYRQVLVMQDGTEIPLADIIEIE
jgi:hypothetical protein